MLILENSQKENTHRTNLSLCRLDFITSVEQLSRNPGATNQDEGEDFKGLALPPVNLQKLRENEAKAASKIGVGASKEAQTLFDALAKTMDCRWDKDCIVISKLNIIIQPPYQPNDCHGGTPEAQARIKKFWKSRALTTSAT